MYKLFISVFLVLVSFIFSFAEEQNVLSEKLIEVVKAKYGSQYEVDVDLLYLPNEVKKNINKAKIVCSEDSRLYGKTIVPVYINSKKYNSIFVVSLFTKVYVASKNISRGDLLDSKNLKKIKKNVSSFLRFLPESNIDIKSCEAKSFIAKGDVILKKMIIPKFVAKRGTGVTIVAKKGKVTVECAGKILQDAYLNDEVIVENLTSQKKLKGLLIEPRVVLLEKYLR